MEITQYKPPTLAELYSDTAELSKRDELQAILDSPPKSSWVKTHKYIAGYKYLPIDKVEYLLKKIFKRYDIEVLREGTAFNGVYVVVRVHYRDVLSGEMRFHDGIGAAQLQTAKGTSPADMININNGALQMAFPIAKTVAIKDACDHFGKIFGSDLNRKDTQEFTPDVKLKDRSIEEDRLIRLIASAKTKELLDELGGEVNSFNSPSLTKLFNKKYETI